MIQEFHIKNCGLIKDVQQKNTASINLIIGENDTGKTFILKSLYVLVKSLETFNRGDAKHNFRQLVSRKIKWTFNLDRIGDLVSKGGGDKLSIEAKIDEQNIYTSFTSSANTEVGDITSLVDNRDAQSVFIPAKEVLSLSSIIRTSRERDLVFGFDDTYLDLVNAIDPEPMKGKNKADFAMVRKILANLLGGKVERKDNQWIFKKGNKQFTIFSTAEGVKKIAIIDRLIGNKTLSSGSILFIDEPEAVLHPKAIVDFLDIIQLLSNSGIQVFMATHSYFVIKKLQLIAEKSNISIPVISLKKEHDTVEYFDLLNGMPPNPIVDVSVRLYEEEIKQQFDGN
ncbi:MAG: AAA15 family ATPase/GTPase [Flammeovirgaceae bacterium]|jgi:AAA15 family ATPase/GTPase